MDKITDLLEIKEFRGVLLGTQYDYSATRPGQTWCASDGARIIRCRVPSSILRYTLLRGPMCAQMIQMVGLCSTREPDSGSAQMTPVIVATDTAPGPNDVLRLLPPDYCPVPGVIDAVAELVAGIEATPLREMVERVLHDREVCEKFWKMPASNRHHHAFPGGLAFHSAEVASDLASQSHLTSLERDLGIAGGVLHDIGKVWSYTVDMFPNAAGKAMGHELIGVAWLEEHLIRLQQQWADGAYAMRVLLSGSTRMRDDGSFPLALVARIKAADYRSCEADRRTKKAPKGWLPQQWNPAHDVTGEHNRFPLR